MYSSEFPSVLDFCGNLTGPNTALCLASKSATRILVYGYTKGAKPVLRIEIRIEGRCNPSVRFDGSLLTMCDDLGHLRAYELTYGEQIRDLNL
jgi:hypothetical protein